jgi:hypothetical protein
MGGGGVKFDSKRVIGVFLKKFGEDMVEPPKPPCSFAPDLAKATTPTTTC